MNRTLRTYAALLSLLPFAAPIDGAAQEHTLVEASPAQSASSTEPLSQGDSQANDSGEYSFERPRDEPPQAQSAPQTPAPVVNAPQQEDRPVAPLALPGPHAAAPDASRPPPEPEPAQDEPAPVPSGDGLVFGAQASSQAPADDYQPDWSRFDKGGLFGNRQAGPPSSDESVDLIAAETHYLELLNMNLPERQRMKTLLDLAQMYHKYNVRPKEAAVYERFIETYPQDPIVPEIYMRLGFLYRDIGAFKTALSKFYSVLNASLAVNRAEMETYKLLSLKAQIEIGDTYYAMGDYAEAAKCYLRLKRLDMAREDRVKIDFKYAYTQYLLKDYATTISSFQGFIRAYPDDALIAEAHFVLATAYKQINQPRAALAEVLSLLQYQDERRANAGLWNYWKRRTGNQLGNEFYEQGDFESALRIYQAMAPLSDDPGWQWPVLFQMGLCFERLHFVSKAMDAYEIILSGAEELKKKGYPLSSNLEDIVEQAQWRRRHLDWKNDTDRQMQQIMAR